MDGDEFELEELLRRKELAMIVRTGVDGGGVGVGRSKG